MRLTVLAAAEVIVLALGAFGALRFVRRVGRGDAKLVLMVAVSIWFVIFGLLPFFVFSVFVPRTAATPGSAGPFETVVLNLVPWALAASPFIGIIQGFRQTRSQHGAPQPPDETDHPVG